MSAASADDVASLVLSTYAALRFRPPDGQFTILAGFVLADREALKVISLGTGSKCLPAARLPKNGEALHDSHAEVLTRRGAIRWFLQEIGRCCDRQETASRWIVKCPDGKFSLKDEVKLSMYISTVPCGDASTRYLASFQDPDVAAFKNSTEHPTLLTQKGGIARGRDNYSLYGVLRTKPGRADSPPTLSMSCSDKIAVWNVLGIQGALTSLLLHPVYISRVVIGNVEPSMCDVVLEDCQRALYGRLHSMSGLPTPYRVNEPLLELTSVPYAHSRFTLGPAAVSGCNDSLCYIADSIKASEVLINGIRRGVPPKHRHNPKFRPVLSKLGLYVLFCETLAKMGRSMHGEETYHQVKQKDPNYCTAKTALKGPGGRFEAWVTSGQEWEEFSADGSCLPQASLC